MVLFSTLSLLLLHQALRAVSAPVAIPSAPDLIDRALSALGGEDLLRKIKNVVYRMPEVYRSQTLMESYSLHHSDNYIATAGHQNITFSYDGPDLQQRIDRVNSLGPLWLFGDPELTPLDFTLTVKSGDSGYACYIRGHVNIFRPPGFTEDYVDEYGTGYYVYRAQKTNPLLLLAMKANNASSASSIQLDGHGPVMPVITDDILNITVILDPETSLPHTIRSQEHHHIFGPSLSDLHVYNYTNVGGAMFPRRLKAFYNREALLEDLLVEGIDVDAALPVDFFNGLSTSQGKPPAVSDEYDYAELGEWIANGLWQGPYTGTISNLSATNPIPGVRDFYHITFKDAPDYTQMVMVFEDAVIVGDAVPHQSHLVLQWAKDVLKRNVTHVWSSVHHHDHSYGMRDYVNAGATAIVPEIAREYWSRVPGIKFITYTDTKPYFHRDGSLEARFTYVHNYLAESMSYASIAKINPGVNDTVAIFESDFWNPGVTGFKGDHSRATALLQQLEADKIPRNTIVLPAHGIQSNLMDLITELDYNYPSFTAADYGSMSGN